LLNRRVAAFAAVPGIDVGRDLGRVLYGFAGEADETAGDLEIPRGSALLMGAGEIG
jgi:hypothetical protein